MLTALREWYRLARGTGGCLPRRPTWELDVRHRTMVSLRTTQKQSGGTVSLRNRGLPVRAVQPGLDVRQTDEGVPQDDAEAVRWYRLAAEQGLAEAQRQTWVGC